MSVLTAYRGVVEKTGLVRLHQAPTLPAGTEVVVVMAQPLPSIEEQKRRLAALSPEEWRKPFDELIRLSREEPAEVDIESMSDEELVALVHEVRESRQ